MPKNKRGTNKYYICGITECNEQLYVQTYDACIQQQQQQLSIACRLRNMVKLKTNNGTTKQMM